MDDPEPFNYTPNDVKSMTSYMEGIRRLGAVESGAAPFFGEPWPSGVCDYGVQVPTPIGELCLHCDEPIEEGQQGTFMFDLHGGRRPTHRECSLRSVLGGIAHMRRTCSCFGGTDDPDGGMPYRRSALLVWAYVLEHGTGYPR